MLFGKKNYNLNGEDVNVTELFLDHMIESCVPKLEFL